MRLSKLFRIFILLGAVCAFTQTQAQITAHQARKEMGRGINLGNTLEPESEGGWNNGPVQEYYFDMYKEAGFSTVRIPIRWDKHTATTSPFTINEDWFDRIEEIVDWGLERNLFIVINLHHEEPFKSDYTNQHVRYDSIWSQISVRFKDKSEKLLFEIVNEPNGLTQTEIDEFNKQALSTIRKNNPTRIVIYSGKGWSSANDLMEAAIPDANDRYLMGYYHSYDPWNFAGEGIGTWGTQTDIQEMVNRMSGVQNWSIENNIPVFIGEFGAVRSCDYNSRMFYYATYTEKALEYEQAFAEWDDGGDFKTMQRTDSSWNDIKDILIYTSDTSPTGLKSTVIDDTIIQIAWTNRSNSKIKVLIQKKTSNTEYLTLAELGAESPTTFIDSSAVRGKPSYYRVVDIYENTQIPSYPISTIPTLRYPFNDVVHSLPGIIEAEDYDFGGQTLTYNDTESENIPGDYRPDEGVDIEARPDEGFQVGYVEAGEWIEYTVNIAKTAKYTITADLASMEGGGVLTLEFDKSNKTVELTAPKTNSWTTLETTSTSTYLVEGEQIMRVNIKELPAFNIDKFTISEYISVKQDLQNPLKYYPNPANNNLFLLCDINIIELQIFNTQGSQIINQIINNNEASINIANLKSGIYFMQVKLNNEVQIHKFIKE